MMNLSFERIDSNPELLEQFADAMAGFVGARISTAYNKASQTWGLFIDGQLKGGYVIASGAVMRVPLIVPAEKLAQHEFLSKFEKSDWCEVNQLWLSDDIKSYSVSLQTWLHIRKQVLKSGHSILFVPWLSNNAGLDRFYRSFTSHIIFQGKPKAKLEHSYDVVVGIATMHDVKWATLKQFPTFLKKILRGKARAPRAMSEIKVAS